MNCIDVHRKLTTEPDNRDEAVNAHLQQCQSCNRFAQSLEQFDHTLHDAANIKVPEGLAERILLKHSFQQQRQQRTTRLKLYAIAASIVVVLGISFHFNHPLTSLEEVTINHVANEIDHLNEHRNVQLAKLNTVLQPFNIKLNKSIGQVSYAGSCPIRNSRGVHIVLQGENETATVLLMPGEHVTTRTTLIKGDFKSVIIPVKNGSIAIITRKNSQEELEKHIEQSLYQAIQYI